MKKITILTALAVLFIGAQMQGMMSKIDPTNRFSKRNICADFSRAQQHLKNEVAYSYKEGQWVNHWFGESNEAKKPKNILQNLAASSNTQLDEAIAKNDEEIKNIWNTPVNGMTVKARTVCSVLLGCPAFFGTLAGMFGWDLYLRTPSPYRQEQTGLFRASLCGSLVGAGSVYLLYKTWAPLKRYNNDLDKHHAADELLKCEKRGRGQNQVPQQ